MESAAKVRQFNSIFFTEELKRKGREYNPTFQNFRLEQPTKYYIGQEWFEIVFHKLPGAIRFQCSSAQSDIVRALTWQRTDHENQAG